MIFFRSIRESPTRGRGSNIHDLILITSPDYVQDVQVGEPFPIRDHNLITYKLSCKPYKNRQHRKQYWKAVRLELLKKPYSTIMLHDFALADNDINNC
jgi:hypothetical protein